MSKNIANYIGFSTEPSQASGGSGNFKIFDHSYFKRLGKWQTLGGMNFSPGAGVTSTEATYQGTLYTYIAITSPTTMYVDSPTNFDVIVIGGGGGSHAALDSYSGSNPPGYAGGGGAGGVAISTNTSLQSNVAHTITIGNGGPAGSPYPTNPKPAVPGSPSSIVGTGINIVGLGGGSGNSPTMPGPANGGSGGGSAYPPSSLAGTATQPGQSHTSPTPVGNYGHPGGPGFGGGSHHSGSGGGGAGGAGVWPGSSAGGPGGVGIAITSFPSTILGPLMPSPWATAVGPTGLYAGGGGGGGGGTGGPGGGGPGSVASTGGSGGIDHTGGGAGAGRNAGGKGIVLLRTAGSFIITKN